MKRNLLFNIIISISVSLMASCAADHEDQLTVTNPLEIERLDELIVVKRSVLEEKIGKIPLGKYAVLNTKDNKVGELKA